jgi:hypothetical protein
MPNQLRSRSPLGSLKNEKNEWKPAKGSPYSANLLVKKDTDNHYLWEPAKDMKLSDYITLLQEVNTKYTKLK